MLKTYAPAETCGIKINKMRPTHTAFEVPVICGSTTGGIVDCMRVQEYFGSKKEEGHCCWGELCQHSTNRLPSEMENGTVCQRGFAPGHRPDTCDVIGCRSHMKVITGEQEILITCYEIKISKSDFKSQHGHNFVGNCNYYVMPKELYPEVKDLIPEDIGVILFINTETTYSLRKKKECQYKPLTDEEQKWYILSVMKRMEDMLLKRYIERLSSGTEDTSADRFL